jgi:hypothetical protein
MRKTWKEGSQPYQEQRGEEDRWNAGNVDADVHLMCPVLAMRSILIVAMDEPDYGDRHHTRQTY